MSHLPKFSLIIPTLNEEKALPTLLNDLKNQSYRDFEIIIVDGKSSDKTEQKATEFRQKNPALPVSFYQVSQRNVAFQRNYGAAQAKNEWLIFLDADDQVPKFFLLGLAYQLEKSSRSVDLFSTLIHLNQKDAKIPFYHTIAQGINLFLTTRYKSTQPLALGALLGVRQDVFAKVQFNPENKVMEDSIWVKKARRQGFRFTLFHEPTYAYSMRRVKGKGLFKTAKASFLMQMRYLFGDDFKETDCGYEMFGGQEYDKKRN